MGFDCISSWSTPFCLLLVTGVAHVPAIADAGNTHCFFNPHVAAKISLQIHTTRFRLLAFYMALVILDVNKGIRIL